MFFYLVDERTMRPVIPEDDDVSVIIFCPFLLLNYFFIQEIYPIRIKMNNKNNKQFIKKVLPLMNVGLKAMAAYNTVAGLG